jgi:hypothetical protein
MIRCRPVAIAALFGLLACGSASAAEQVVVRATVHAKDRFGRIAFIWPAPVRYQARLDGTVLTIHFARPMTAKLDTIPKRLHTYVLSVRMKDNATVVARVTRGATLRSFVSGNTVAVDIALKHRRRAGTGDAPDVAEIVPPPELIEPAWGPPEAQPVQKPAENATDEPAAAPPTPLVTGGLADRAALSPDARSSSLRTGAANN